MKESKTLEFKETVSNTFLKTVSAYANYNGGQVIFGIKDDGSVAGLPDLKQACLDIENRINDSIDPVPEYELYANSEDGTVTLTVLEGRHKPYLYKSKAYRRNDTSTVEADRPELKRLIMEGDNLTFEEIPSRRQELSFTILETKLKEAMGIDGLDRNILKTLELYKETEGFNNAAAELADENDFIGTGIVRFGTTLDILLDEAHYSHVSLLKQYDNAVEKYRQYYRYEKISGVLRETVETIPEKAYREAVANALVHRRLDMNSEILISMLQDKIIITSPGGLPEGISEEEYLSGNVSVLRNPIIGNVFYRLDMIERFGTGVLRIKKEYENSASKPSFEVFDNSIRITLPVVADITMSDPDRIAVYSALDGKLLSSSEVARICGFSKSKALELLKQMTREGYATVVGNGRGTKYRLK